MPVERMSEPSRPVFDAAFDKVAEKLRADPKTFEQAHAFARLRDELHLDEEGIAARVGMPKSVVSRLLALLKQPGETQKLGADESISPDHLRPLESIAHETKRIELAPPAAKERLTVRETERRVRQAAKSTSAPKRVASESIDPAALHSAEPSVSAPTEIQKTTTRESTSSDPSPQAIVDTSTPIPAAARATIEHVAPWELERRMQLSGELNQSPTIHETIASWCTTISSLVRGPLRNALWEFYDRMTEAATWWRLIKRVLHFLARFIPGREPEPTKLQKAIKECFSFLHEPPPSEPQPPPKKPDADPPKAP